jgi:hypothetical protein
MEDRHIGGPPKPKVRPLPRSSEISTTPAFDETFSRLTGHRAMEWQRRLYGEFIGANRLAAIGLSALTCVPVVSGSHVRLSVIGGAGSGDRFSFAWPIWKTPASLAAIRALLSHPGLREPGTLDCLGVDHVRVSRRISLDRLRNFTAAEPLTEQ